MGLIVYIRIGLKQENLYKYQSLYSSWRLAYIFCPYKREKFKLQIYYTILIYNKIKFNVGNSDFKILFLDL